MEAFDPDNDDDDLDLHESKGQRYSYSTILAACNFRRLLVSSATMQEGLEAAVDMLISLGAEFDGDTLASVRILFSCVFLISINQSINQLINQSINQSTKSINQSIDQSTNQPIDQSINRLINQSINQSID